MDLPIGIKRLPHKKFTNAHENFTQHLEEGSFFTMSIGDPEFKEQFPTFVEKYQQTTKNFQWLISYALDKNIRLRAVGSGWSFSKVAMADGGIINTKNLRLRARLNSNMVAAKYTNRTDNLLLVQCGNSVLSLNEVLEKRSSPKKSLSASGGSNGQTIVGAFSTGTHGAAFKFGALSEFIVGMHLVTGPDSHHWIERKTYPVTSEKFREKLATDLVADDDVFNAALVSFGSFGCIHSVLLEVEPIFYLEQESKPYTWDANLEKAAALGDFSGIEDKIPYPVDDPNNPLYHWEIVINPHDFKKNDPGKGAYVRTMYKFDKRNENIPVKDPSRFTYGDSLTGLMQSLLDVLQVISGGLSNKLLIPGLVNGLFKTAYDRPGKAIGTIGETFKSTIFRGKLFSAAFGFNRDEIVEVVDIVLALNRKSPFAGAVALRFVKGTKAILGFTKFENTCVLELDGIDANVNHRFAQNVAGELEKKDIQFTMHWGKINKLMNRQRLSKAYGEAAINKWLRCRAELLDPDVQEVFNNEFMERLGLDIALPLDLPEDPVA